MGTSTKTSSNAGFTGVSFILICAVQIRGLKAVFCKTNSIPICCSLAEKSPCMEKMITRAMPGRSLVPNKKKLQKKE